MTSAPLVSIVVPVFNAARWLGVTLLSALAQTHAPCEIIVVDDGSSDESLAIAMGFRDRGVIVVSQPNRGAAAARNHALRFARGEFIQYLDADDLLAPDKIARQLAVFDTRGRSYVASCEWVRFTDVPPAGPLPAQPIWHDMASIDFLVAGAMDECMFPPIAWLIPRALCDAAGPWNEALSVNDDGEYMSRVLAAASGLVFTPGARAFYRSGNAASYASQRSRRAAESELAAWDRIVDTMLRLEDSARVRTAAATGYQRIQAGWLGRHDDVVALASTRERAFGKGRYRFEGGALFRSAVRVVGWKSAVRMRRLKESVQAKGRV